MKTKFSGILTLLLAFVVQISFAQQQTVTGTVSDQDGLPLPGATVIIKGTSTGTTTDFDGKYSIGAATGDVLQFSYVGYSTLEVTVTSSTANVTLQPDNALEEVVVTALGIKKKPDEITTANQVVEQGAIIQANNPDVVSSLTGKVSGLQINTTSSGVSDETRVVLRGVRSLTGDNQALVVIDGAISTMNFLKSIDPNAIESVNVMKGPNGAALYGSAGANGVVIVTTKKGSKNNEKFTVDLRSSAEFETISFVPERQTRYGQGWSSSEGWSNYTYENGGWGPEFDGQLTTIGLPQADGSYVTRPYSSLGYDNILPFFQTGVTTQNSVLLSSGNLKDGYVNISAQRRDTEFVIKNDKLAKNTFNFKAGKELGAWTVSGNVTYTKQKTQEAVRGLYEDLLQVASNIPVEAFEHSGNEGHWNGYYYNPYWKRDNIRYYNDTDRISLTGELGYKFNDNINVAMTTNALLYSNSYLSYTNAYSDPQSVIDITGFERIITSSFSRSQQVSRDFYTDVVFNFDYDLTEDISFKANVGVNNRYSKFNYIATGGDNLTIPGIYSTNNVSSTLTNSFVGDDMYLTRRYSVFGQVDLGYKDFLFLNATARNDWTSVLEDENNSFFYPSVGLSFLPTKAFNFGGDVLNHMKLFGSVVRVGNDGNVAAYQINALVNQASGFPFAGQNSYVSPTSTVDTGLTPEFITSFEIGANLGFFKNRVTLDGSYYKTRTKDQIMRTSSSYTSGLTSTLINIGDSETTGGEIDLGLKVFSTPDFSWDVNLSYSTNKTIVKKLASDNGELFIGGYTASGAGVYAVVGEEFPMLKGNDLERDEQGRVIIGSNGNPTIAGDLKTLGYSNPDYILGLNTQIRFKNFTLSGTFDYRTGHQFYSQTKSWLTWSGHLYESGYNRGAFIYPNSSVYDAASGTYVANTSVTTGNTTGALSQFYSTYVANVASQNILDATAFKIRELGLKYDLPSKFLEKTALTAVTLGVTARNPVTILPKANRGYADPESNFTTGNAVGVTNTNQYPETRTYGFSLNIIF